MTPEGATWAACPAPPVQERGNSGVLAQQERGGYGSPQPVGVVGMWDEGDMQREMGEFQVPTSCDAKPFPAWCQRYLDAYVFRCQIFTFLA